MLTKKNVKIFFYYDILNLAAFRILFKLPFFYTATIDRGITQYKYHSPRFYSYDLHRTIDMSYAHL